MILERRRDSADARGRKSVQLSPATGRRAEINSPPTKNDSPAKTAAGDTPNASPPNGNFPQWLRRHKLWAVLLVLSLALLISIGLLRHHRRALRTAGPAANVSQPIAVTAAAAQTGDLKITLNALGSVTAINSVTIRPRVDGQLIKVLFREGQTVNPGDLLAEIDPRPLEVQLAQAQGQMDRDQALLRNAQLDVERYRDLYKQDSIAKQQLDTQEALVQQYEGTVKADRAQVDNAKLQLSYTRVTAPLGGRVGLRKVDPGNMVHANDQDGLVVITQLNPITVIFSIPEDNVPALMQRLQAGAVLPVEAYSRDRTIKLATGQLLTVDNQIDVSSGTIKLKAQFNNDNSNTVLFPNQFVNVRLLLNTLNNATLIPTAAVKRNGEASFVYRVQTDHTVKVQPVSLGPVDVNRVAVTSGIAPGDLVVVDGTDKLRDGTAVELSGTATGSP
ncbi:MAG: MdtA/MuxA family multidrug efflux RND transporter periplasmic adaptor subunit [Gammaproteobacteria bacterium]|nr:MdtA/MuxA family multidrug efflux RND transporter periplasmic adaptor subunit [Gammaproteobacteria bacterium]